MKIINPQVNKDLAEGKMLKLNLGSGETPRKGLYAVDRLELAGVDIIADLNEPLDLLQDNCVDTIYSRHTFEHVLEFLPLMREIYRITCPGGKIEIITPHFSNVYGFSDPTHERFFGLYSMYYFVDPEHQPKMRKVPAFYSDVRFKIESIKIEFYRAGFLDKLIAPIFSRMINRNIYWQDFYERRLTSFFHAWQIRYLMQVDK